MTKTFTADQISPYFAEGQRFDNGKKFATYRFYEKRRWDGKEMLMIEIELSNKYYSDDGKIISEELK